MLVIGSKGEGKEMDSALFILGEKNILDALPPLIERLLETPECIQNANIVRWQMTSFG